MTFVQVKDASSAFCSQKPEPVVRDEVAEEARPHGLERKDERDPGGAMRHRELAECQRDGLGRLCLILAGIVVAEPAAADALRRFVGAEKPVRDGKNML